MRSSIVRRLAIACLSAAITLPVSPALAQDEPEPPPATVAPPTAPPPSAETEQAATQSADLPLARDLIQRCIDAVGGREPLEAIRSSAIKAQLDGHPAGQIVLDINWMAPNRMLVIATGQPGGIVGSDGEVTWAKGPGGYEIIPNEMSRQIRDESSRWRLPLRIEADYKDLKTVERLSFADRDCYKVTGADVDGTLHAFFFDAEDHLLRGAEATDAGLQTVTARFSEWKEGAGIRFFTRMDISQSNQTLTLTFTKVEFNTLDEPLFALPAEVQAMLKEREAPVTTVPDEGGE